MSDQGFRAWLPPEGDEFFGLDRTPRPWPTVRRRRRLPRWLVRLVYAVRFRIEYGEWPMYPPGDE